MIRLLNCRTHCPLKPGFPSQLSHFPLYLQHSALNLFLPSRLTVLAVLAIFAVSAVNLPKSARSFSADLFSSSFFMVVAFDG